VLPVAGRLAFVPSHKAAWARQIGNQTPAECMSWRQSLRKAQCFLLLALSARVLCPRREAPSVTGTQKSPPKTAMKVCSLDRVGFSAPFPGLDKLTESACAFDQHKRARREGRQKAVAASCLVGGMACAAHIESPMRTKCRPRFHPQLALPDLALLWGWGTSMPAGNYCGTTRLARPGPVTLTRKILLANLRVCACRHRSQPHRAREMH
jgi:hypothetical protein